MGRHDDVYSFYLGQLYMHSQALRLRDNANFFVIFKQNHLNLKHIYDDYDMPFEQFRDVYLEFWKNNYVFLRINNDCSVFIIP